MKQWEEFEEYLFEIHALGLDFNSKAVAHDLGISNKKASAYIQSYLSAQTNKKARTLFVLTRKGRTARAMWHVGARTVDARQLGRQTADDFKTRLLRYVEPTLNRIAQKNPRALPAANAVAKAMEASVELLVAMLDPE